MSDLTNDMNVRNPLPVNIKKVGAKELQAVSPTFTDNGGFVRVQRSNGGPGVDSVGDVVKRSMDRLKNPPGPRQQMCGQQNSKHYNEDGKAFKSYGGGSPDSDAGN